MRVGFVAGEYPPMQGGVGAFTREVAREMVRVGHEVCVFTRIDVGTSDEAGIEVTPTVGKSWGWNNQAISDWVKASQIDIVNIQFQTAAFDMHPSVHLLPMKLDFVPVVVTFHDLRVPYLFPKAGPVREWIVRHLAKTSDGVIATDREDQTKLTDQWQVSARWIPIGSNIGTRLLDGYNRMEWRRQRNVQNDELLISYFGFLNESKGGLVLIEALAHLVNAGILAKLVMIGGRAGSSDPTNLAYGEKVDALIVQYGLQDHIHWTGFVDDHEVTAAFVASDLTALPYLDGVSLRRGTLMAALAHGKAIVTTHPETDAPELNGAVETVDANDADVLADSLKKLWWDKKHREQLEKRALQTSEYFTWENITQNTLSYFEEILESYGSH